MKKAKLFLPLLSLATVWSVALPLVSCGCNGNKQEDEVVVVELQPYLDDTLSLLMSDPIDVRKDETYEVSIKCGDFPHFLESDEKTRWIITILDNSSGQYYNLSKSNASLKLNNKNYELEHYTNNLKYSHFMWTDNWPYCEEKTIFLGLKRHLTKIKAKSQIFF